MTKYGYTSVSKTEAERKRALKAAILTARAERLAKVYETSEAADERLSMRAEMRASGIL